MKEWNFKLKSNPREISAKLEDALGSANGFVFNMDESINNSITFKIRKRILYAWYLIFSNNIIVNGKLLKSDTKNVTDVKISFTQHFLMVLVVFTNIIFGLGLLIALISGIINNTSIYAIGGIFLLFGISLWFIIKNRFDRKVQEYQKLISGVLEL
ncbi:DUF423 domain-containing protein [Arenibacter echinorum]|uniref:Uncharacterized protein n=1 Tax=Arenibacter echinorum TaxID=440515 RepID=A0A327R6S7_9FLAO|nr:DUF423 domain-containing protein [Arenibacter echinorum]RAJ12351.1 hypothetical protein LV92_01584 [Arenibacter echinorum]